MNKEIICLGIETTAHTFGASIVKSVISNPNEFDKSKTQVLSNVKKAYTTESGGMIPFEVSEHHVDICDEIILKALTEAKVTIKDINLISFSQSPGIGSMLRVGAMSARSLSVLNNIPLIGVNHCIAHLEIGRLLTDAKDPILLYASGANTQVIAYEAGKYRIFGETLDIGIGNFLDQFARYAGLGFPGGPKIGQLAHKYKEDCKTQGTSPVYVKLPYSVKGMDVSFGGILSNLKQKLDSKEFSLEQLCYSLEETVYAMLCEVTERALAHCQKTEVLLGGGVACSPRLQKMCKDMCEARNAKCFVLENQYNVDNAAMIAWLGILMFSAGITTKIEDAKIEPYLRTDDIAVTWR
jgi:glycoprotease/Kae1 family metallohydrolase